MTAQGRLHLGLPYLTCLKRYESKIHFTCIAESSAKVILFFSLTLTCKKVQSSAYISLSLPSVAGIHLIRSSVGVSGIHYRRTKMFSNDGLVSPSGRTKSLQFLAQQTFVGEILDHRRRRTDRPTVERNKPKLSHLSASPRRVCVRVMVFIIIHRTTDVRSVGPSVGRSAAKS